MKIRLSIAAKHLSIIKLGVKKRRAKKAFSVVLSGKIKPAKLFFLLSLLSIIPRSTLVLLPTGHEINLNVVLIPSIIHHAQLRLDHCEIRGCSRRRG